MSSGRNLAKSEEWPNTSSYDSSLDIGGESIKVIVEDHHGDGLDEEDELSTSTADTEALEASIDWNPTQETNFSNRRDLWAQNVALEPTLCTHITRLTYCVIAAIMLGLLLSHWTMETVQEAAARDEERRESWEGKSPF